MSGRRTQTGKMVMGPESEGRAKSLRTNGAPGAIRTRGLRIRSPLLYPAELRARAADFTDFRRGQPLLVRISISSFSADVMVTQPRAS